MKQLNEQTTKVLTDSLINGLLDYLEEVINLQECEDLVNNLLTDYRTKPLDKFTVKRLTKQLFNGLTDYRDDVTDVEMFDRFLLETITEVIE